MQESPPLEVQEGNFDNACFPVNWALASPPNAKNNLLGDLAESTCSGF